MVVIAMPLTMLEMAIIMMMMMTMMRRRRMVYLRMNWSCMSPPHPTQVLHQSPEQKGHHDADHLHEDLDDHRHDHDLEAFCDKRSIMKMTMKIYVPKPNQTKSSLFKQR